MLSTATAARLQRKTVKLPLVIDKTRSMERIAETVKLPLIRKSEGDLGKGKVFHTPRKKLLKIANLIGATVWTMKPSKLVHNFKPPYSTTKRKLSWRTIATTGEERIGSPKSVCPWLTMRKLNAARYRCYRRIIKCGQVDSGESPRPKPASTSNHARIHPPKCRLGRAPPLKRKLFIMCGNRWRPGKRTRKQEVVQSGCILP